jgi:hypothetical protein
MRPIFTKIRPCYQMMHEIPGFPEKNTEKLYIPGVHLELKSLVSKEMPGFTYKVGNKRIKRKLDKNYHQHAGNLILGLKIPAVL